MLSRFSLLLSALCAFLVLAPAARACIEVPDVGGCVSSMHFGELEQGTSNCTTTYIDTVSRGFPITFSYSISGPGTSLVSLSPSCNQTVPAGVQWEGCTFSWTASQLGTFTSTVDFAMTGTKPDGSPFSATCRTLSTVTIVPAATPFNPSDGVVDTLPPVVQNVPTSGVFTSLSVAATMKFDPSVVDRQGSMFLGARVPPYATFNGQIGSPAKGLSALQTVKTTASDTWYISNGSQWNAYFGGSIPPLLSGILNDANARIPAVNGVDTSKFCDTEFYVGYGTSGEAMLANNTLGKIYTVMCNFGFVGVTSGTPWNLTLAASIQVATADSGRNGAYYIGRLHHGQWSMHNGSGWVPYDGGPIPPYASGTLFTQSFPVFNDENLSAQSGMQVYAGYGLSSEDMLNNRKYGLIYSVE